MRFLTTLGSNRAIRWLALLVCLAALLVLLPTIVLADEPHPLQSDPGQCAVCHKAETQDWQNSPHAQAMTPIDHPGSMECDEAQGEDCTCLTCHTTNFDLTAKTFSQAGVTCEACHGAYVEGHPENGEMQLDVDSSVCSDCHQETHVDWQGTAHAEAGVQCIGCHRSHTQNLRLEDEVLCKSCHRDQLEDAGHAAHARASINCVDCHTSPTVNVVDSEAKMGGSPGPSHQFNVAAEACATCHGASFHEPASEVAANLQPNTAQAEVAAASGEQPTPAEIVAAESNRRSLQSTAAVSFGLGVGFGSMAGIIFVLAIGLILQRPWRAKS